MLDAFDLTELFQLTHLNVSNRQLTALPESLGALHQLQKLDYEHNQLRTLPESLGQLRSLKWLNWAGNQLQTLPESLAGLSRLAIPVDARNNPLTHIPQVLHQKKGLSYW